ncbi:YkgJ family cysteine cluster protein [Spirochaetota bacterium]
MKEVKSFKCIKCGNCCKVNGYVRLSIGEELRIAGFLDISVYEFTDIYTKLTDNRMELSLVEKDDGSCIFITEDNLCGINEVKPQQCREFPLAWSFDGYKKICSGSKNL